MAAIAFNTAHQAEHVRQKVGTALTVLRKMLDAFVSSRMRKAAAAATRRAYGPAMIPVRPSSLDLAERASYASPRRDTSGAHAARAHLSIIKRFCMSALVVLAAGSAIAATIALKAAMFLWVFHYY